MIQAAMIACLPWAALVLVAVVVLRLLVGVSGAKMDIKRLMSAHRCEKGSVQSLSFVLTLPFFLLIMMLIVQASQIMIANITVHYAAYASARSAAVWIPSNVSFLEMENRISSIQLIEYDEAEGARYRILPSGEKYQKIRQAAILALTPLGPSRDLGYSMSTYGNQTASSLANLYPGLDSVSVANQLISTRLENKLAYCYANTDVDVTFWHRTGPYVDFRDPPLQVQYEVPPYWDENTFNEIGWQDHITATVSFNIPLLPGPVRLFAPAAVNRTDQNGQVYAFLISASATMVNEGEKPVFRHWQEEY